MHLLIVGVLFVGLDHKQNDGLVVVDVMKAVVLAHGICHAVCKVCGHIILGYAPQHLQADPQGGLQLVVGGQMGGGGGWSCRIGLPLFHGSGRFAAQGSLCFQIQTTTAPEALSISATTCKRQAFWSLSLRQYAYW